MARILFIEDDPDVAKLLSGVLKSAGHDVVHAQTGRDALTAFKANAFDLVVTDILLPDNDGLEIIPQLRKSSTSVKIIAISGGGRVGPKPYLSAAKALGANRTLTKPFAPVELARTIQELLES